MYKILRQQLLAVGAIVIALLASSAPATAQCLPDDQCADLRSQLREFHKVVRPIVREIRQLRQALKDLAEDSPERPALRDELRAERRKLRRLRRGEILPLVREYRQGCKRC
ncbi:MAG: hypothetical protein V3S30_07060 [Thermoanaerobaculia bacterium]